MTVKVVIGIAAGLLTGVLSLSRAHADQTPAPRMAPTAAERTTHETAVVMGIDRGTRNVTLQNADGEKRSVKVPADVKAFDTLKVGDRVDIDYYEAMAVSMAPPGTKPSVTERTSGTRMGEGSGAGGVSRETTVAAEIVSIDTAANKVTFKGPKGGVKTVTVSDPAMQKKLPGLKPGQVVQFTYTEAIAASIRPAVPPAAK
jgi:Cu/Ag efflux protein CusF